MKPLLRRVGARDRLVHRRAEGDERGLQQFRVDGFLGLEMEIEGGRRVAGRCGDGTEASALEPVPGEDLTRRVENVRPLHGGHGLLSLGSGVAHARSITIDNESNNVRFCHVTGGIPCS